MKDRLRITKKIGIVASLTSILLATSATASDFPSSMKLGTASQGGTYFIYGSGVAKLIQEKLNISTSAEVSGGPIQNLALVEAGQIDLGLTSTGPAQQSVEGKNPLMPGSQFPNLRVLFPMYQSAFQMASLTSSGVSTLEQLNGRTMGVGPKAGTTATYLPSILQEVGINVTPRFGGAGDQAGQLQDGMIDSLGLAAGIPVTAFTQVEAQNAITPLGFSDAQVKSLTDAFPSLSPMTIKAGTYKGQNQDVQTVSMWNFVVANKQMSNDLAYAITKTILESNDDMMQVHRAAAESLAKNMVFNGVLPIHPGAAKYYREIGVDVCCEVE